MASTIYTMHTISGPVKMRREKKQGRIPSGDAKVIVPFRLRPSVLAKIAERGERPQAFIEHLVLRELVKQ